MSQPLCVDLDGTLIRTDTLWEQLVRLLARPLAFLRALAALAQGKAAFKARVGRAVALDPATLPYNEELLAYLRLQKSQGRRLILATACNDRLAGRIAAHLGLFDEIVASSEWINMGGRRKQRALVEKFGPQGFDYVGDHCRDIPVFAAACKALLVQPSRRLLRRMRREQIEMIFAQPHARLRILLRAMRVHQYAKNLLIGVPILTAHLFFSAQAWLQVLLALICFSTLASATYIVNDLHDLDADRIHAKKRQRPFASGALSIPGGIGLACVLGIASFALAGRLLPPSFSLALALYAGLTLVYSFQLKQRLLVDVITLAALYTLRIIAGALVIHAPLSEWLLMFSMFFFLSMALVKRFIELDEAKERLPGRGYAAVDIDLIRSLGVGCGLLAVLVFALYLNSPAVLPLYGEPRFLWILCALLFYWIARIWFLANRGQVHHDPIVFALSDWHSYLLAAAGIGILILAMLCPAL